MSIELKVRNEVEFPHNVMGSLVVGEYIYILSDYLYKYKYHNDGLEYIATMEEVIRPRSICSDGELIYTFGYYSFTNHDGASISVIDVSTFTHLVSYYNHAETGLTRGRITNTYIDNLGFLHTLHTNGDSWPSLLERWTIWRYNKDTNSLTFIRVNSLVNNVASFPFWKDIYRVGNKIILNRVPDIDRNPNNITYIYEWDGVDLLHIKTFNNHVDSFCVFNGNKLIMTQRISSAVGGNSITRIHELFDDDIVTLSVNEFKARQNYLAGRTVSDGENVYMTCAGSNILSYFRIDGNEFVDTKDFGFPSNFSSVGKGAHPSNIMELGNDRLYVVNGNKLYVLGWVVSAIIEASTKSGIAPLTVNFKSVK